MPTPLEVYPIDYTGVSPANLIERELHTLTELNDLTRRTLVPFSGPFYRNNFVLEFLDSDGNYSTLTEGEDYYFSLRYIAGWVATSFECYGGVTVTTELVNGSVLLTYQTMGTGFWNGMRAETFENFARKVYNPRSASWDVIANLPQLFPPGPHQVNWQDTKGLDSLIDKMNELVTVVGQPRPSSLFYPQMVVEVLSAYEGLRLQYEHLAEELNQIKQHLNLS